VRISQSLTRLSAGTQPANDEKQYDQYNQAAEFFGKGADKNFGNTIPLSHSVEDFASGNEDTLEKKSGEKRYRPGKQRTGKTQRGEGVTGKAKPYKNRNGGKRGK